MPVEFAWAEFEESEASPGVRVSDGARPLAPLIAIEILTIIQLFDATDQDYQRWKCKMSTAPCIPRRSPIQVLTWLNVA